MRIPNGPERAWLTQAFEQQSRLLVREGRPLILPNDDFFPDVWTGNVESIKKTLERVHEYMGWEASVNVRLIAGLASSTHTDSNVNWVRTSDEAANYTVFSDFLHYPKEAVVACVLAAVQAYRAALQLNHPNAEVDAELVDISAIVLGFGVITFNGAQIQTTRVSKTTNPKYGTISESVVVTYGTLPIDSLGFLLSLFCKDNWKLIEDAENHLQPNQQALIRAIKSIDAEPSLTASDIHRSFRSTFRALPLAPSAPSESEIEDPYELAPNSYRASARTELTAYLLKDPNWIPVTFPVAAVAALLLHGRLDAVALAIVAVTAAVVWMSRVGRKSHVCSNCNHSLSETASICDRCQHRIVGIARTRLDTLKAPDEIEAATRDEIGKPTDPAPRTPVSHRQNESVH